MPIPTVAVPSTRDEIAASLRQLHTDSLRYWGEFDTDEFFRPLGTAWSPAQNVRHLTKSIRPVAKALRMPRLVLWVLFGRARTPSGSYEQVVERYHELLAGGADAGRFAPSDRPLPADLAAAREQVMAEHQRVHADLLSAIARWSEPPLDRCRMPHPLLGKLTVREMLFFTLYHNLHHVQVAERRRAEATAGAAS
jgi:hypothetical protein